METYTSKLLTKLKKEGKVTNLSLSTNFIDDTKEIVNEFKRLNYLSEKSAQNCIINC